MDGVAEVRIALELGCLRQELERLVLILLGGIARREESHDRVDPLAVCRGGLRGLRRRAQELLELGGKSGVVPEREECVRLHLHHVFPARQTGIGHRLPADDPVVGSPGEGISLPVLLSRFPDGFGIARLPLLARKRREQCRQECGEEQCEDPVLHGLLASSTFSRPFSTTFTLIR